MFSKGDILLVQLDEFDPANDPHRWEPTSYGIGIFTGTHTMAGKEYVAMRWISAPAINFYKHAECDVYVHEKRCTKLEVPCSIKATS